MARKPKKYHYIYKTTCKITGKFYVGMHSSDSIDDGYLGSGKILGYSRKKYGDENHVREILEFCSSRDELKQREKEIVNEELLANPLNINLKYGGEGGWEHVNKVLTRDWRIDVAKISNASPNRNRSAQSAKTAKTRKLFNSHPSWSTQAREKAVIMASMPEAIAKRKATFAARSHACGKKNSQYGVKRIGINKDGKIKKILPEQLQEFLNSGWTKGFK
jgi:hypothetical protein